MFGLALVTEPTSEPVSLSEVKADRRVTDSTDDGLLAGYILGARQHVETIYGLALRTQTLDLYLDEFPADNYCEITLPRSPVQSITSITYIDTAGTTQTWAGANYQLDNKRQPSRVLPAFGISYPSTRDTINAVTVRFIAGYADTALPDAIRRALLLLVGHFYENREPVNIGSTVTPIPMSVDALLAPYRSTWFS